MSRGLQKIVTTSLFSVYLQKSLMEFKYYKVMLIAFFLTPLLDVIKWYLTGEFVKEIDFYNTKIKYFYFLVFSTIVAEVFHQGFNAIINRFYRVNFLYRGLLKGLYKSLFYELLIYIFDAFMSNLPIISIVLFLFSLNARRFMIAIVLSISLFIFSIALAMLVTPLLLYFRGEEADIVIRHIGFISQILVPIMFSFYLLPYYKILAVLLPSIGIVEEIRRYLFLGFIDVKIFILALISSISYLVIGVVIFSKALEYARREGWIGLK